MARTMANELYNWSMLKWNTTWNMLKNICVIEPDFLKTLSMSICIVMLKAFWVWLGEVARYAKKHGVCSWCTVIHSAAASALWLGTGGHCHHRVFLSRSSSIITSTQVEHVYYFISHRAHEHVVLAAAVAATCCKVPLQKEHRISRDNTIHASKKTTTSHLVVAHLNSPTPAPSPTPRPLAQNGVAGVGN